MLMSLCLIIIITTKIIIINNTVGTVCGEESLLAALAETWRALVPRTNPLFLLCFMYYPWTQERSRFTKIEYLHKDIMEPRSSTLMAWMY